MESNSQQFHVALRTATWERDSNGLFDYESQNVQVKLMCTKNERMLIRSKNGDVHLINEKESGELGCSGTELLFKITPYSPESGKIFRIETGSLTGKYAESNDQLWLVINSLKKNEISEDYKLQRGDILKFGRMRLKVKDLRIEGAPDLCDRSSCLIREDLTDISTKNERPVDENDTCRICFIEKSTIENPLLAPCNCSGTMKFIHYKCLERWLNQKLVSRPSANIDSYYYKSFACEICKTKYPCCIKHNDEEKYLIDVNLPEKGNYLLLESLTHERTSNKAIHLIKPDSKRKEFTLGEDMARMLESLTFLFRAFMPR